MRRREKAERGASGCIFREGLAQVAISVSGSPLKQQPAAETQTDTWYATHPYIIVQDFGARTRAATKP